MEKKKSEHYNRIQTIGQGAYGKAYLVQAESDGAYAVIKQVDIADMDQAERKATLREAKVMEVLHHPNIVGFKEVYKTKKGILCIVMEYCDDGDADEFIIAQVTSLDEALEIEYGSSVPYPSRTGNITTKSSHLPVTYR